MTEYEGKVMINVRLATMACVAVLASAPAAAETVYLEFTVGASGNRFDFVPCTMAGAATSCPVSSPFYREFSYAQNFYFTNGEAAYHYGYLYSGVGDVSFVLKDLGQGVFQLNNFSYGKSAFSQGGYGINPGGYYESAGSPPLIVPAAGAVPETAAWAMMIAGFGALCGTMRRQNAQRRVRVAYA